MTAVARLAALAALVPTFASAQPAPGDGRGIMWPYMMGWGGSGWGMMILGPLFMILVLVVVVGVVVLVVRAMVGPVSLGQPPSERRALDILKERYARGEIDKTEFEERRRVLGE